MVEAEEATGREEAGAGPQNELFQLVSQLAFPFLSLSSSPLLQVILNAGTASSSATGWRKKKWTLAKASSDRKCTVALLLERPCATSRLRLLITAYLSYLLPSVRSS